MFNYRVFFWFITCALFFSACNTNTSISQTNSKTINSMIDNTENLSKEQKTDTAIFAAGCFWCVEGQFKHLDGVQSVKSGYIGGTVPNPTYEQVCTGTTGHAEAVRVIYDADKITYDQLLAAFFVSHDPTKLNRQGNDIGTQYRSAVFPLNDTQKEKAQYYISQLNLEKVYTAPIVTSIEPLSTFYDAEAYHDNYFELNPQNSYCQLVVKPKIEKFKKVFADKLKQ
ncbi:MAG: peptide-methionine (S)-S-oxide reductase MsrA [Taibaiella sp.]|nr:peptide-methionine (S)-S-oxide reductase MsrA [Taibaiella sp.]